MVARLASAALGVWLMAAPAVLGYGDPARTADRIAGPVVFALGFVGAWPVMRSLRRAELVAGVWLVLAPWVLGYNAVPFINGSIAGLLLAALSFAGGETGRSFGGGWSAVSGRRERRPGEGPLV